MRRPAGLALALLLASLLAALALRPRPPARLPPGPPRELAGHVEDGHGPVAGCRVRCQGEADAVLTAADGSFRLRPAGRPRRVTAWKEGYFIAGDRADAGPLSLRLTPLPAEDHEAYEWVDPRPDPARPQNCGNCHGEIYREWAAGGHARSATGRHFRGLYAGTDWHGRPGVGWGLLNDHPDGAGVCSACHAPSLESFNDPAYTDLRLVEGVAALGVHCDYCHKVAGTSDRPPGRTHGRFDLRLLRPAEGQLFFGPLDDVDRGEDAYSPLYRDSRYCAACHEGTVFGVHVYSTYSEWLASPARREGKHCQTCHMAPTGRLTNIAPGRGGIERDPRTLGNHRFFAGSQADMLRRCLKLSASLTPAGDGLRVDVELTAEGIGHRVPTGFVDRNLLLVVEASGPGGRTLEAAAGPRLPAAAGTGLAGRAGKVYAKLLRGFDGCSPAPFWQADGTADDTRLDPGRPDRVGFTFPSGAETVRVRLLHRKFWRSVAEAKGWPDDEVVVVDRLFPAATTPGDTGSRHPASAPGADPP